MVRLNIESLNLEAFHDVLRVFNGCCEDASTLLREFTGRRSQGRARVGVTGRSQLWGSLVGPVHVLGVMGG